LSRCRLAGLFVLTLPHTQGFFAQAEFVRDTGDRSVRGVRIGLGMDDELDSTRLEFVGVFHWQERISFFQSPCLYYPRGDSPGVTMMPCAAMAASMVPISPWRWRVNARALSHRISRGLP